MINWIQTKNSYKGDYYDKIKEERIWILKL